MSKGRSRPRPIVLAIGGFDPSCGAGVAADLKTIAACGCYGVAAITALTVQNTRGVRKALPVSRRFLAEQIEHLLADVRPSAVKVGMMGSKENVDILSRILSKHQIPNFVLDPVLKSSSGHPLLPKNAHKTLMTKLVPLADCFTPNIHEAALLAGTPVETIEQMKQAAAEIASWGPKSVVVTGGHLKRATDVLYDGTHWQIYAGKKIKTRATHGTGCTFSSALASYLALGLPLKESVRKAKWFVTLAIAEAYPVGHGHGPLNHFFGRARLPY